MLNSNDNYVTLPVTTSRDDDLFSFLQSSSVDDQPYEATVSNADLEPLISYKKSRIFRFICNYCGRRYRHKRLFGMLLFQVSFLSASFINITDRFLVFLLIITCTTAFTRTWRTN